MTRKNPNRQNSNVLGAGAAGGALGTLIASLAEKLPESSEYKSILIMAAPLITVLLSGIWLFLKTVYIDPFVLMKRKESSLKMYQSEDDVLNKIIKDAKSLYDMAIKDPNSNDEHKQHLKERVEELEMFRLSAMRKKIELEIKF